MTVRSSLSSVRLVGALALQLAACSNPETEKVARFEKGKALAASGSYSRAIL